MIRDLIILLITAIALIVGLALSVLAHFIGLVINCLSALEKAATAAIFFMHQKLKSNAPKK